MRSIRVVRMLLLLCGIAAAPGADGASSRPFLATGVRVGEVGMREAIVWVRLTAAAERNWNGKTVTVEPSGRPPLELAEGWTPEELAGSCPGAPGSARVVYSTTSDLLGATATPWREALPDNDFIVQFPLSNLRAGTLHHYRVETRSPTGGAGASFTGSFRTAPGQEAGDEVVFTVVTGMMHRDLDDAQGFRIYQAMARQQPHFLVATGDTVYYDSEWPRARGVPLARFHWHRMYSLPRLVEFHRRVPGYWMKDDHDTLDDDSWPGRESRKVAPLTFVEGQRVFREQVPMGARTYRTARHGKHLQIWLVEGRDFRSPNPLEDGPEKTIWGEEQKRWLKETLLASDATFKVLISPTPIVGPDRPRGKNDNHSNAAFRHEGEGFRRWARMHLGDRFYVVCGDRHWQYHSVDPGSGVQEFSCGPASDEHAGGSPGFDTGFHRFHRVRGGYLSVTVSEVRERPAISFRFHDTSGGVAHEYREYAFETSDFEADGGRSAELVARPLYGRLLEEARERLAARARAIAELAQPSAIAGRRDEVRRTILDSFGGFPERSDLNARVVGRVERDDHVLEKVVFESLPRFHVTANLYLPRGASPPYPAILFPCGHSTNGKAGTTYQTAGQEFARRGFAVLIYDPIGQGERFQFLDESGKPIVGGTTEHTLTGTAALLVGSNTAAVIIWDGIRAVDYLATRDDIDLERLGCTGNSGGGTQTSYLMALEPRLRAAAPSCYLTTLTRLFETIGPQDAEQNFRGFVAAGLDHADFVLAFAPRPALICAATDDFFDIDGTWTTFREAKRIYGRLGRPGAVDLVEVDAKHGYHPAIRQRVGRFFEEVLMGRSPAAIAREVELGTVHPDEALHCTATGQVVSSLGGRTVADLWRDAEKELRPEREKRFRDMPRDEWLRRVRDLAAMASDVPMPQVRVHGRIDAGGAVISRLSWEAGAPVEALLFHPGGVRRDEESGRGADQHVDDGVEVIATDEPLAAIASRLSGRASGGETVLLVELPGLDLEADRRTRSEWGADWKEAFLAFHLGRSLAGIRADALRQAARYGARFAAGGKVRLTGIGRAAVPALLAAAVDSGILRVRLERGLHTYASIVDDGLHHGRLGNIVPGALAHFDLPLLREAVAPRDVRVVAPVDPHGAPLEKWPF